MLIVITRSFSYLSQLEEGAPSHQFLHPVRVLEVYLGEKYQHLEQKENLLTFIISLCLRGYHSCLANFVGRQCTIAPSEDFEDASEQDNFIDEFYKQPKNKALLDLLCLPFQVSFFLYIPGLPQFFYLYSELNSTNTT